MRKASLCLVIVAFLALSARAFAFQNEPDGFRGLKWGDPPGEDMKTLTTYAYFGMRIYERRVDKMKIGGALLRTIYYEFFEDRFMAVEICPVLDSSDDWTRLNYDALKNVVFLKFGNGVITKNDEFTEQTFWLGEKGTVVLTRYLERNSLVLIIHSTEIWKEAERRKEEERQKAVEKGLEDF